MPIEQTGPGGVSRSGGLRFTNGIKYVEDATAWSAGDAKWNADGTALVGAGGGLLRGPMTSGVWFTNPSVFRLRLTGTGPVQFDSRDSAGNITAVATYTLSGATDQIEFPYAGDNAAAIRATFSGDITVEVL